MGKKFTQPQTFQQSLLSKLKHIDSTQYKKNQKIKHNFCWKKNEYNINN